MNLPVLIISDRIITSSNSLTNQAIQGLVDEVHRAGYETKLASNLDDGLMFVEAYPDFGCILLDWDMVDTSTEGEEVSVPEQIIRSVRGKNQEVPIFLLCAKKLVSEFPLELKKEVQEYIYLYTDTPVFIAGRIDFAVRNYYKRLLPPFFRELKNFAEDAPYYWDCPGHMGGVAYLKHAIGSEFHKFFGEALMRADVGVMASPLGDWLTHSGVPGESEENAARIFGADRTFYVLGGSSASNQIVARGSIMKDQPVIVDRNCHKSINHALTITDAKPSSYLIPKRNGYGILGLIPASDFPSAPDPDNPVSVIITNCTYDGICYKVGDIVQKIGQAGIPQIHFDEAWYAHAKFHPMFQGYYAMDTPDIGTNMPLIFAVQSTHKMLPALSMASMIHVKEGTDPDRFELDRFNHAFMMHGTTSPLYPLIASIDVATAMMETPAGETLLKETIRDAIDLRQEIAKIQSELENDNENENENKWFFGAFQPDMVKIETEIEGEYEDKFFYEAEPEKLEDASHWILKQGETWHGFSDEDVANDYYLLDPTKVTITTPGVNNPSLVNTDLDLDPNPDKDEVELKDDGIPAKIVAQFLESRKINIAKGGDYIILVLFSVGNSKGKWGTLLEALLGFKDFYDNGANISEAIPNLAESNPSRYGVSESNLPSDDDVRNTINDMLGDPEEPSPDWAYKTLKELCQVMHKVIKELALPTGHIKACNAIGEQVLSPGAAYQTLIDQNGTTKTPIRNMLGQTSAVMVAPYPPGIPILMPGEKVEQVHIDYMKALEVYRRIFPEFGGVPHGLEDDGGFVMRKVGQDDPATEVKTSKRSIPNLQAHFRRHGDR